MLSGYFSRSAKSSFRNVLENTEILPTHKIQTTPPNTAAGKAPKIFAATPDSNSPSSLDDPMKMEFTAAIRPRMESGEES